MKAWRFITIMLAVFSSGAAVAHLLEMPAKLLYDGALWLHLLQTRYPPRFGPLAGTCEIAAVIASVVLVLLLRRRAESWGWSLTAAVLLAASHAIYWIWVVPVNTALVPLAAETLPDNWTRLRDQWENATLCAPSCSSLLSRRWCSLCSQPCPTQRARDRCVERRPAPPDRKGIALTPSGRLPSCRTRSAVEPLIHTDRR